MPSIKKIPSFLYLALIFTVFTNTLHGQEPVWIWADSIASDGKEEVLSIICDKSNNDIYIAGQWETDLSAIFPSGANSGTDFTSSFGKSDAFVAKFDSSGTFLWAFKLGGKNNDLIQSIKLNPSGGIFITGYIDEGPCYFSGTSPITALSTVSNTIGLDCFVAYYNPDGEFQWVRTSSSDEGDVTGQDIIATPSGIYVSGTYTGACTFGAIPISQTFGGTDIFLAKYDAAGTEQWVAFGGSNNDDAAKGIIADKSNVYLTGWFTGLNLQLKKINGSNAISIPNMTDGKGDIILASYSLNGDFNWARTISGFNDDFAFDIAMDSDSLYITGSVSNDAVFPDYTGDAITTLSSQDVFISSHSKTGGSTGWVVVAPSNKNGTQHGNSIVHDGHGKLFISGNFESEISFPGGGTLTSIGSEDVFLTSYTTNGKYRWGLSAGSTGNDDGNAVATGSGGALYMGGVYMGGMYTDIMTIGPFTLPGFASRNGYLAKLEEPCIDAIGGTLVASDIEVCLGFSSTLKLQGYYGDIHWQSSPAGSSLWTDIASEMADSLVVFPVTKTEYRAYLTSGKCASDTSDIATVKPLDIPKANPGTGAELCGDLSYTLNAVPSIGTGSWTKKSGPGIASFAPNETIPSARVSVTDYGSYELTWTETNGICTDDSTIIVEFLVPSKSYAGEDAEICSDIGKYSILGSTSANGVINWETSGNGTFDAPDSDNPTYIIGSETSRVTLIKHVKGVNSCPEAVDSMILTIIDVPVVNAGKGGAVCGLEFKLNAVSIATADISGEWSLISGPGEVAFNPSNTSNTATVTVENYGEYIFQWYQALGACTGSDTVLVRFRRQPKANAGSDQALEFEFTTYLEASKTAYGIGSWEEISGTSQIENVNDPATMVSELSLGDNEFKWTISSRVCDTVSDNVIITVLDMPLPPTVITPNGDADNEFFVFPGIDQIPNCEIVIFNRWGTKIYQDIDYQNNWNGKDQKGRDLVQDTYFYVLKIPPERIIKGYIEIRK